MRTTLPPLAALAFLTLWLAAPTCGPTIPTDDTQPSGDLQWYATCGDPVCSGYSGPFEGVDACTTEALGASCGDAGAECDPEDDCNALYRCTDEDPTQQPGGCPISRKRHKRDIRYLSEAERSQARRELSELRLATWRYRWEEDQDRAHLGFLIDDAPASRPCRPTGSTSISTATPAWRSPRSRARRPRSPRCTRRSPPCAPRSPR